MTTFLVILAVWTAVSFAAVLLIMLLTELSRMGRPWACG